MLIFIRYSFVDHRSKLLLLMQITRMLVERHFEDSWTPVVEMGDLVELASDADGHWGAGFHKYAYIHLMQTLLNENASSDSFVSF